MKQWIFNKYHNGQNKYNAGMQGDHIRITWNGEHGTHCFQGISEYDFLFDLKWGFAKAIWKGKVCNICGTKLENTEWDYLSGLSNSCWYHKRDHTNFKLIDSSKYHPQQMTISDDPLKYLEQFRKDN